MLPSTSINEALTFAVGVCENAGFTFLLRTCSCRYVDNIPKAVKGTVGALITAKDERGVKDRLLVELQVLFLPHELLFHAQQFTGTFALVHGILQLDHLLDREIEVLSGGELQRFAIAMVAVQNADVYMFDEPSSYLDIRYG
jgi:ATP-binding cassette, sub-family E, member 1